MSTPAYHDGTIYFGSEDGYLYALDAGDLSESWKFETGGDVLASPAVADGMVYFTSKDGSVYCVDADKRERRG